MRFTAKIDTRPIGTYYGQLAVVVRQSLPKTIRFEAAATVRRAMKMVDSAPVAKIRQGALYAGVAKFSADSRVGGTTSVGRRSALFGRQWLVRYDIARVMPMSIWGGKLTPMQNHTGQGWRAPDTDWLRFKSAWMADIKETKAYIQRRLGARGLTAKSWLEIMEKIGAGQMDGVASFVKRARPINAARKRVTSFALSQGEGTPNFELTIVNASGIAIKTGGHRKLASAISIRRKFFADSLRKGFFDDARFVARNYPWAVVK